ARARSRFSRTYQIHHYPHHPNTTSRFQSPLRRDSPEQATDEPGGYNHHVAYTIVDANRAPSLGFIRKVDNERLSGRLAHLFQSTHNKCRDQRNEAVREPYRKRKEREEQ